MAELLIDLVLRAVGEAEEDAILGRPCRCSCGGKPAADHYVSADVKALFGSIQDDSDDDEDSE